jgi:hypothetical protein
MGEETKLYKVLVGKPEGRRPLGRPSLFKYGAIYDSSSSHGGEYEVQNCLLGCTAV